MHAGRHDSCNVNRSPAAFPESLLAFCGVHPPDASRQPPASPVLMPVLRRPVPNPINEAYYCHGVCLLCCFLRSSCRPMMFLCNLLHGATLGLQTDCASSPSAQLWHPAVFLRLMRIVYSAGVFHRVQEAQEAKLTVRRFLKMCLHFDDKAPVQC